MKMIKPTSLFKWPQTNGSTSKSQLDASSSSKSSSSSSSNASTNGTSTQKLWIHPPTTLQNGHIAYLVKYFGNVEVNQPKGIDVVKESINRLKLIQPLKKSDGGSHKIPKIELTISVNGVAIQEPKSKKIYCQFPLHRISYCADDKTEKKFFSFIAKDVDTDKHLCFVFMSEKMSEEIILTIGQAFDLAYAKFIETSGREFEIRKQLIMLQKRVHELEDENKKLKEKIGKYEPESCKSPTSPIDDLLTSSSVTNGTSTASINGKNTNSNGNKLTIDPNVPVPALQPPPSSRNRNNSTNQSPINLLDVDLDEYTDNTLTINDRNSTSINDLLDQDFNPRASINDTSMSITQEKDIFGCEPFQQVQQDPFGMGQFNSGDLDSAIVSLDKKLAEMRDGFSQGISTGGFDMTIDS